MGNYLNVRLPLHRTDLHHQKHWVWLSFKKNIDLILLTMILAGHIVEESVLKFLGEDECILDTATKFEIVNWNSHEEDLKGDFAILDGKRSTFVYSGVADYGYVKSWESLLWKVC